MKTPAMLHHGRKQRGLRRFEPPTSLRRGFKRLRPTVLSLQLRVKRLEARSALERRFRRPPAQPPASRLQRRIDRLEPTVSSLQHRLEPAVSRLRRAAAGRRPRRGGPRGIHIGSGLHRAGRGANPPAGSGR